MLHALYMSELQRDDGNTCTRWQSRLKRRNDKGQDLRSSEESGVSQTNSDWKRRMCQ